MSGYDYEEPAISRAYPLQSINSTSMPHSCGFGTHVFQAGDHWCMCGRYQRKDVYQVSTTGPTIQKFQPTGATS